MKTVEAKFQVLSSRFHGRTERNRENPELAQLASRPSVTATTTCPVEELQC
jgi:hypothetical protein